MGRIKPDSIPVVELARRWACTRQNAYASLRRWGVPIEHGKVSFQQAEAAKARFSSPTQTEKSHKRWRKAEPEPEPGRQLDLDGDNWDFFVDFVAMTLIDRLRETSFIASFARVGLALGLTMRQAFAITRWYELLVTYVAYTPQFPERPCLHRWPEPNWARIAKKAGTTATPAEVEEWRVWAEAVFSGKAHA